MTSAAAPLILIVMVSGSIMGDIDLRFHDDGRTFCFGRKRSAIPLRTPRLSTRYVLPGTVLPVAVKADWATGPALNKAGLEHVLANDQLGDCVEAACGHAIDIWHADAGTGLSVTEAQTIDFYSDSSGYVIGNPKTDNGSDWATVLQFWSKFGFAPNLAPIAGFVAVDPSDVAMVKAAIWLFGNLLIGGELLKPWVDSMQTMQSSFTWTADGVADPEAGHAFLGYGYNDNGVFIDTWGMFGTLPWDALARFASSQNGGDCYCALHSDWVNRVTGLSPSGFNITQLQSDLAQI